MGDYYQVLNERNKLKEKLQDMELKHRQELSILNTQITELKEQIDHLKDENYYYHKFQVEEKQKDQLYHEKWLLNAILAQLNTSILLDKTIEKLKKKAIDMHMKKFRYYDTTWRIEI